ncbi:AAA family ATPase [Streptomyces sp. NPDC005374]|uniref:AAA family ATPase n=1 Tax=Streptomyces sp. NPDC005374 TaxID=3364713 RepID=UPI0036A3D164
MAENGSMPCTTEVLVGRDRELELLRSYVDQVLGRGGVLVLTGEPGVGKSVLLDAAATAATAAGALVLRSDGVEFLADLSFAGLNHVLEPLLHGYGGLDPVHREALSVALGGGDGAPVDRLVLYGAVLALLQRAASSRPVLLVIDDLQWVDRASAAALAFVARRLVGSRVGLLAACRPGFESFFERAGLPELIVPPLDERAAAGLVGTRFPLLAGRELRRVLAQARGNPLALLELPAALGDARGTSGVVLSEVLPLSRRLQDLYASRVAEMPAPTRRLLLLAALEGGGDLSVLRAAAGQDVLSLLAPAERAQLLRIEHRGPGRLSFHHPLIRATVVSGSTSGQRLDAHRALAEALTGQPDRRAWHLAEATPDPDEQVAALLEHTAHQVRRRGDAVGAFNALVRAADLTPGPADRGRRLAEAAFVGADVAGELRTAAELLVEARRADPELRGSLRAAAAASQVLLNRDGDVNTAHRLLVGAITTRESRSDGDDEALFEALCTLRRVCLCAGRPELWNAYHAAMSHLSVPMPPLQELLGDVYSDPARSSASALGLLDAVIHDLHRETDPSRIERVAMAALFVDRATGCRAALWHVVENGREGGAVASALMALVVLCLDDFMTGRWDECGRLAEEGLALCEAHGYQMPAQQFHRALGLLAAARGDDDGTVRGLAQEITEWAVPRGARTVEHFARHMTALAALGRGDHEEAYLEATAISPSGELAAHAPLALWVPMDLVEAAVRSGRRAEALAHVAVMRQTGLPAISGRLALVTAGSAAMAAPEDRAAEAFEEALAVPGAERWPFDLARVRLAYGQHLRRARAAKEAGTHLAAALQTFRRLGATPWVARAAEELRATGRTATRGVHRNPVTSPLTEQELQIASLAAAGLTNKQIGERLFLSHRTVAAHLHRIFPKLGITSRVTLGEALTAQALTPREETRARP